MVIKSYVILASFHFVCIAWFYTFANEIDEELKDFPLGWLHHRNSFLTIISFQFNALYFFFASFQKKASLISRTHLNLVKLAIWVSLIYWLMFLKDPSLVVRRSSSIPPILNYTLHGFNVPLIMVPLFITSNKRTTSWIGSDFFDGLIQMVGYNAILKAYKFRFGFEVYPFLDKLNGLNLVYFNAFVVGWSIFWGFILRQVFFR